MKAPLLLLISNKRKAYSIPIGTPKKIFKQMGDFYRLTR